MKQGINHESQNKLMRKLTSLALAVAMTTALVQVPTNMVQAAGVKAPGLRQCCRARGSKAVCVAVIAAQQLSRVRLCGLTDRSTPRFPVVHHLPEFAQIPVHGVGDAMQPSHPLSAPSPPALKTLWC